MSKYTGKQVTAWVEAHDEWDAIELLHSEIPTAAERLKKATKLLNKLVKDVQKVFPEACLHLDDGHLHLMLGSPYCEASVLSIEACRERVGAYAPLPDASGGGW